MKKVRLSIPSIDSLKSVYVKAAGGLTRVAKSPDEAFDELFSEVQTKRVFDDTKIFIDLVPRASMKQIKKAYMLEKDDPNFDLREFVNHHFYEYSEKGKIYHTDTSMTPREHIATLWEVLKRRNRRDRGSLFALPYAYIVPGGRYVEHFYWDSYFIMLGLAADNRWDMIEGMMKNYAYMLRKFGFIPTANRTYYLSRSQPPFFSRMVKLLAQDKGQSTLVEYLPYLLIEHRFWMKGRRLLAKQEHKAYARVAEMPNGMLLNRYYDNKKRPRPESVLDDLETVGMAPDRDPDRLYLHLRAAAESGWDFSSRWLLNPQDLSTIHTADIIPVDLNCLLYDLEVTIAEAYRLLYQPLLAARFEAMAERRVRAIQEYCWSHTEGYFMDYNFHHHEQTPHVTLAGVFPLYSRIATTKQAGLVAKRIEKDFLKNGGVVTTLLETSQQWDSPNGWAPLQWVVIEGLRNYGHHSLAEKIKKQWVAQNVKVFKEQAKLVEKYDVIHTDRMGGGGEYPLQDGFGWTNGVLAALLNEDDA
jgi:alpha,alpha-trehalase